MGGSEGHILQKITKIPNWHLREMGEKGVPNDTHIKAEERIVEWAIQHWRRKDTQAAWELRQFAALVVEAQGVTFETKDGMPSNGWYFRFLERQPNLSERTIQHTEFSRLKAQHLNIICAFFKELEEFTATTPLNKIPSRRVGILSV